MKKYSYRSESLAEVHAANMITDDLIIAISILYYRPYKKAQYEFRRLILFLNYLILLL